MATESPKERSDEATVTSSNETAKQLDTDSQNAPVHDQPHINGDATASAPSTDDLSRKHISDLVDDLVNSTEVSVSGGSDNEASKGDASKSKEDGKGHNRTSSTVKKPASFKAISVNKTFLHTKGPVPTTQAKPLEKPTTTLLSSSPTPSSAMNASRPRLVAKTGSGLVSKTSGANGSKSTPDANAVWNKNRPVPPPEPKKYTDEELKQYGIHMASRLGPEDVKGENNWADIEDDDEDWAPETITWKDGTKVTIPHAEEHPTPVLAPATPAPAPEAPRYTARENGLLEKPKEAAPPAAPAVTAPTAPAAPPPVIKTTVLASGKGLVLKGAPEKPTLVAKPPPPPAPVKSPWAPIPKPEKVSPIIEPPSHHQAPKYPPRDPSFSGDARLAPKEIAADDFSRSAWRGGPSHSSRELFNSQSGTYEPVADRRGSFRSDQPGRQPALLHRPSHHEQQGPFEPSGPYPAGRNNNEQPGPYGRRRGSSNVSGGSGSLHRLTTLEHPMPPPELVSARRGSMTGRSDSPASPRNYSPSGLQGGPRHPQGWPPRASPGTTHATPYHQGSAVPGPHAQEMPAPHQQSPLVPTASLVGVTEQDVELQKKLMRERRELAMKRRQEQEAKEEAERRERIRAKLEALGPAPESNSAKKAASKDQAPSPSQPISEKSAEEPKPEEKALSAAPSESNQKSETLQNGLLQNLPPADVDDASPHTHTHPWPNASKPADRYPTTTWGPQTSTAVKNVWGAPNNNRTLGNGTFVSDLGNTQPLPHQLPGKPGPGPIAPPTSSRSSVTSQVPAGAPTTRLPPIGPPRQAPRNETPAAAAERREVSSNWATAVGLQDDAFQRMVNSQWDDRDRRLKEAGLTLTDVQPVIKDTWRPVKLDAEGRRIDTAVQHTVKIGKENPWAAAEVKSSSTQQEHSISGAAPTEYGHLSQSTINTRDLSSTSILGAPTAPQHARGSRFFPQSRDVRLEPDFGRPKSPSPPPPEMPGHPAFDGDVAHPHVSLPCPRPVVRLPPSAAARDASGAGQAKAPNFAWASQAAYKGDEGIPTGPSSDRRPSFNNKQGVEWQARIDNLLGGRKNHPNPKSPGLDFGDRPAQLRPGSSSSSRTVSDLVGSATTKVMAEECFEEQEMGSLPPVRLPNVVPALAWQPVPAPKPLPKKFYVSVSTVDAITFPVTMSGAGTIWYVSFPGSERREIVIPHGRNRSNPRRGGQRGGRGNGSASQYRQGKGRDMSSSYSSNDQGLASSTHAPSNRGGRGGYRSRDNWSRNSPAPIHT
ncbi:hypothetical protein QBC35DRAFT_388470 [Podospora australis]|uniref:Uncharacterized protein n=1 Tax=Podospora australis TaxID=1536484 RepID=A0AAN6WPH2_9PEZI|nr:hypothetical protein QBC35DRAFT_388470 [Podospora australis]